VARWPTNIYKSLYIGYTTVCVARLTTTLCIGDCVGEGMPSRDIQSLNVSYINTAIKYIPGGAKKRPELCITITARILYGSVF